MRRHQKFAGKQQAILLALRYSVIDAIANRLLTTAGTLVVKFWQILKIILLTKI